MGRFRHCGGFLLSNIKMLFRFLHESHATVANYFSMKTKISCFPFSLFLVSKALSQNKSGGFYVNAVFLQIFSWRFKEKKGGK
jgi:hypothetical protein